MRRNPLILLMVAASLLVAGCSGPWSSGRDDPSPPPTAERRSGGVPDGSGGPGGGAGTAGVLPDFDPPGEFDPRPFKVTGAGYAGRARTHLVSGGSLFLTSGQSCTVYEYDLATGRKLSERRELASRAPRAATGVDVVAVLAETRRGPVALCAYPQVEPGRAQVRVDGLPLRGGALWSAGIDDPGGVHYRLEWAPSTSQYQALVMLSRETAVVDAESGRVMWSLRGSRVFVVDGERPAARA
jgi:hypothetical protein